MNKEYIENINAIVVACLDPNKYGISYLQSRKVILTKERENHIKNNHSEVLTMIYENISEIISDPDAVYSEINRNDTRWVIKELDDKDIRIVIKLCTEKSGKKQKTLLLRHNL